jgi:hypothetical protein
MSYSTTLRPAVITHSTAYANEDENEDPDVESQDEGEMGYGCPGGGFTPVVGVHPHADIVLKYVVDNLKGHCTAQPVGSPDAVGS